MISSSKEETLGVGKENVAMNLALGFESSNHCSSNKVSLSPCHTNQAATMILLDGISIKTNNQVAATLSPPLSTRSPNASQETLDTGHDSSSPISPTQCYSDESTCSSQNSHISIIEKESCFDDFETFLSSTFESSTSSFDEELCLIFFKWQQYSLYTTSPGAVSLERPTNGESNAVVDEAAFYLTYS